MASIHKETPVEQIALHTSTIKTIYDSWISGYHNSCRLPEKQRILDLLIELWKPEWERDPRLALKIKKFTTSIWALCLLLLNKKTVDLVPETYRHALGKLSEWRENQNNNFPVADFWPLHENLFRKLQRLFPRDESSHHLEWVIANTVTYTDGVLWWMNAGPQSPEILQQSQIEKLQLTNELHILEIQRTLLPIEKEQDLYWGITKATAEQLKLLDERILFIQNRLKSIDSHSSEAPKRKHQRKVA